MREKENFGEKEYDFSATLVFLVDGKKVWLAPKIAKIGKKRLNGYGGEVEPEDVSIEARAVEEAREESRVHVLESDLELCAIGYFTNIKSSGEPFVCKVYIYIARRWVGIPKRTKEMGTPKKYDIYKPPVEKMMVADRYWIGKVLKGKKLIVKAIMKNSQAELIGQVEVLEVETLEDFK